MIEGFMKKKVGQVSDSDVLLDVRTGELLSVKSVSRVELDFVELQVTGTPRVLFLKASDEVTVWVPKVPLLPWALRSRMALEELYS